MAMRVDRTVGELIELGIAAHALCSECRKMRVIDLERIAQLKGPDYSYWNRRTRCTMTKGCTGSVRFYGRGGWPHLMADDETEYRWMFDDMDRRWAKRDAEIAAKREEP